MTANTFDDHLHALTPGTRLDDYVIETVLGKGGFGMTYRAWDETLNMAVAIKEYLPTDIAGREDATTVRPVTASAEGDFRQGMADFLEEFLSPNGGEGRVRGWPASAGRSVSWKDRGTEKSRRR